MSNNESCTVNDDSLKSQACCVVEVAFATDFRGTSIYRYEVKK